METSRNMRDIDKFHSYYGQLHPYIYLPHSKWNVASARWGTSTLYGRSTRRLGCKIPDKVDRMTMFYSLATKVAGDWTEDNGGHENNNSETLRRY